MSKDNTLQHNIHVQIGQDREEILAHLKSAFKMSKLQVAEIEAILEELKNGSKAILTSIQAFQPDFVEESLETYSLPEKKPKTKPKADPKPVASKKVVEQVIESNEPALEPEKESFKVKAFKILSGKQMSAKEVCDLLGKKVDNNRGEFADMMKELPLGYTERKVGKTQNKEKVYASIEWFEKNGVKEYYILKDGEKFLVK